VRQNLLSVMASAVKFVCANRGRPPKVKEDAARFRREHADFGGRWDAILRGIV
jgi:hypothetical protein